MVHKILTNRNDETDVSDYTIKTDYGCTLEQFLKEIINENTETEGRVQVSSQLSMVSSPNSKGFFIFYKQYGNVEITNEALYEEYKNKTIKYASAKGTWNHLDYFVIINKK